MLATSPAGLRRAARLYYLIRTLNVIVPDSPGFSLPSIAQRRTSDPAELGVATNVAGRDDLPIR